MPQNQAPQSREAASSPLFTTLHIARNGCKQHEAALPVWPHIDLCIAKNAVFRQRHFVLSTDRDGLMSAT
jgi:hypothetical protein